MSDIEFSCPACNTVFSAEPSSAGQNFKCTNCGTLLNVPALAEAAAASGGQNVDFSEVLEELKNQTNMLRLMRNGAPPPPTQNQSDILAEMKAQTNMIRQIRTAVVAPLVIGLIAFVLILVFSSSLAILSK